VSPGDTTRTIVTNPRFRSWYSPFACAVGQYESRNANCRPGIEQRLQVLQESVGLQAVACLKALAKSITNR
jgi:hypothetical protein